MKIRYTNIVALCLFSLIFAGIFPETCLAQTYNQGNRAGYQVKYRNPIASIPVDKAQRDLIHKLSEVYPNHKQKRVQLFSKGMNDYTYLCRPNDVTSVRILTGLARMYYPHFTTIRLLYEQKIRRAGRQY